MIKLATIGTNWITQKFVDAVKKSGKYTFTSVYSRKQETGKAFADQNGVKEVFSDLNLFFKSGNFDTVYIASPNSLHFNQAKLAIQNGKNVIVEKPAFMNQKQMSDILEFLKKRPQVKMFEAARNIHTANFQKIASQVSNMSVIQGAEFTYSKYSSRYDAVLAGNKPNVFSLKFAGGALLDLGVYTVYDAVALFGMPEEVSYHPQLISTGVDGKGTAVLDYDDFTVTLNFSKITNSTMTSEIYGLKDYISIDNAGEINKVNYIDSAGKTIPISTESHENSMLPEVLDFARVLSQPNSSQNQKDYQKWLNLSINVNKLMFNLRQDAHVYFVGEQEQK